MATGAYLAERAEIEVAAANVERERREIAENPDEEREELSLFYQLKGIDEPTPTRSPKSRRRIPERCSAPHARGAGGAKRRRSGQEAIAAGISTGLGAIIPVIPFVWLTGTTAIVAAAVSLIAHFLVGAAKSLFTLRSWWAPGLEMTLAGIIVGGVTYAIGLAFA